MKHVPTEYTDTDKMVALAFLDRLDGDFRAAARKTKVPEQTLRFWTQGGDARVASALATAEATSTGRPLPPAPLMDTLRYPEAFEPSHDLAAWVMRTFISVGGPLHNEDHAHLSGASIGFLWTNVPNKRQMRQIAGEASVPTVQGTKWTKSRAEYQLAQWFGAVPDFLITLDTVFGGLCDDTTFAALIEHELYHCSHATDDYGCPKYRKDGSPVLGLRSHDVEEFVGVVARYGAAASTSPINAMVKAATSTPLIGSATVSLACGNCLPKAS